MQSSLITTNQIIQVPGHEEVELKGVLRRETVIKIALKDKST